VDNAQAKWFKEDTKKYYRHEYEKVKKQKKDEVENAKVVKKQIQFML